MRIRIEHDADSRSLNLQMAEVENDSDVGSAEGTFFCAHYWTTDEAMNFPQSIC